jgi:carboxyl-terminal processing protease
MNNERIDQYRTQTPRKPSAFQPLYYAIVLIAGLIAGSALSDRTGIMLGGGESNPHKLVSLINFIEKNYVDSVDRSKLVEDAINSVLRNLDPHSYYLSPDELARAQEELSGGFQGIGVEFMILRDSLMVVRTIPGGPSEKAGLLAGDRIVGVDGKDISGKSLSSDVAQKMLKGEAGSRVSVSVHRRGLPAPVKVEIIRGSIPIESVPIAYRMEEGVGYLRIDRFARTTYQEFVEAMDGIVAQGCRKVILDFRGNGGGLLDQAIAMTEEFLTPGKVIVYTEGVHDGREVQLSEKKGKYRDMEVIVLIDQGSASASEIVAGALQDWDRSVTVGRRSFGKGLVQREIELSDKSALRLTVARYYTPTGRCIQKPYGDSIKYEDDFHDRLVSGELMSADQIKLPDSLKKVTPGGRTVYGGGGIVPDIFVPLDSNLFSGVMAELNYLGLVREFVFDYMDRSRKELARFGGEDEFIRSFRVTPAMITQFASLAASRDPLLTRAQIDAVADQLRIRIKAQIARTLYTENAMHRVLSEGDTDLERALEIARSYKNYAVALPVAE